jgi:hypothetical protein
VINTWNVFTQESTVPFISIQSIYKKVATIISTITERIATNFLYDVQNSDGVCRPVISADGVWMMTSAGSESSYSDTWTGIRVYKRTGGPGTEWTYIQEILPPGWNAVDRYQQSWGLNNATMSKDGTRIAVLSDQLYIFVRSGDVWSLEDSLTTYESQYIIKFKPETFNTTTGVDAATDTITFDSITEFSWGNGYTVVYDKEGGSANIGLTEYEPSRKYYYYSNQRANTNASSINTSTNVITTGTHGFTTGDPVRYSVFNVENTSFIDGLTFDTVLYYVRVLSATQFTLHPTATDAINNTNIIDLELVRFLSTGYVISGGSGYTLNDVVDVTNGTLATGGDPGTYRVSSVNTGVVTGVTLYYTGRYLSIPSTLVLKQGQTNTSYNNSPTTEGTFAGGTGYTAGDVLTLSNGATVTVNTVSSGVVATFTVTTTTATPVTVGVALTATGGTGSSFTLTPDTGNVANLVTVTGGTGTGLQIAVDLAALGSNTQYFQHAQRISLYETATDADGQINKVPLTSIGGETHTIAITSPTTSDWVVSASPYIAINDTGTRIVSQAAVTSGTEATLVVWERSGSVWTEVDRIPVRDPNVLDLDLAYWQPGDNAFDLTKTRAALSISGDGNTVAVGVSPGFSGLSYVPVTGYLVFTASNPTYGNKPTIEIVGGNDEWDHKMKPGTIFRLQTNPVHVIDGVYVVDTIESPRIITINAAESEGTIIDYTSLRYSGQTVAYFEETFLHVYTYNGSSWSLQKRIISPEVAGQPEAFAETYSVLSTNGNVLAVSDDMGPNSAFEQGRVYVFERSGSVWSHLDTLAPDSNYVNNLGQGLALNGAGTVLVAGAPRYGFNYTSSDTVGYVPNPEGYVNLWPRPPYQQSSNAYIYESGKVYIFTRPSTGVVFSLEDTFVPFAANDGLYLGDGVDLSSDGKIVVAGAAGAVSYEGYAKDSRFPSSAGTVFVLEELTYVPSATITRHYADYIYQPQLEGLVPTSTVSEFGKKHKISSDGSTLAICYEDSVGIDIYTSSYAGPAITWTYSTTLYPSTATLVKSLDINATGTKIVLSCDTSTSQAIVTFVKTGSWTEYVQNAIAISGETLPRNLVYGEGIAISGDGTTLCIEGDTTQYEELFNTATGVNTSTDVITFFSTTNNRFETGETVWYVADPGTGVNVGLNNVNTIYYVRRVSGTQVSIHTTYSGAIDNTGKVNLTASGTSVTQRIRRAYETKYAFPFTWNGGLNQWDLLGDRWIGESKADTRNFARTMALSYDGTVFVGTSEYQNIAAVTLLPNSTGTREARTYAFQRYAAPTFVPQWVTVVNGGTGYTVNDILTVVEGTPQAAAMQIRVTGESGGVITSAIVETASPYDEISDALESVTVTGGTGTNAVLQVWWNGARYEIDPNATITIAVAGTGYGTFSSCGIVGGTYETKPTILAVDTVDISGGITAISLEESAVYTSIPNPTLPVALQNIDGSAGTVNLTWRLADSQHKNGYVWLERTERSSGVFYFEPSGLTLSPQVCVMSLGMSSDGAVVAVGHTNTNFIYISERNNATQQAMHQTAALISDTPNVDIGLGSLRGLAVSGDGSTIVAGAWKKTVTGDTNAGALFVFRKANLQWRQEQYIPTPCPDVDSAFGSCVSINDDGSIITVSAPGLNTVYTYTTSNPGTVPGCPVIAPAVLTNTYTQRMMTNPSTILANQYYGESVAIDSTGTRMLVSGAETKVFRKSSYGDFWEFEQELIPTSNPTLSTRVTVAYGAGAAISEDGTMAVVTAALTTNGANTNVGEAYVFLRTGETWVHDDTIYPTTIIDNVYFGQKVVINPAKNVIAISSNSGFGAGGGQAYVYRDIAGTWTGVAVSPTVASTFSGGMDYVDNGTNKGLLVFGGQDAVNQARIYVCEHTYGTPDTLTVTSTYVADVAATGFGVYKHTIKFSADKGQYIIVSDPYYSNYGGETLGQVYVLKNSALTGSDRNPAGPWTLVSTIVPTNLGQLPITILNNAFFPYIAFGSAVGITSGGDKLVITSADFSYPEVLDDYNAQLFRGGSVWVYQKGTGDTWTVIADRRLFPQNPNGQQMGYAMAHTPDVNTIVLGGPQTPGSIPGTGNVNNYGQAQIFEHKPVSTDPLWTFTNTEMLEDSLLSTTGGLYYGEGPLALSRDGKTIAATYGYAATPTLDIYVKSAGAWTIDDRVTTTLATGIDRIKISDDGNVIVASNSTDFEFVTLIKTAGVWAEEDIFVQAGTTPYTFDFHLSGNGTTLFVMVDNNGTPDFERKVYVYVWNTGTTSWDLQDSTTIATTNANVDWVQDWGYGMSSSYSGDVFVQSFLQTVNYADPTNYESPAAYIWRRSGTTWNSTPEVATTFWYSQSTNGFRNFEGRVRMTADGEKFAISNGQANRTWVMVHDRNDPGNWNVDAVLTYEDPNDLPNEGLGQQGYYWATEISDDGKIVLVGQWNASNPRGIMFRKVDDQWRTEKVFYNPIDPTLGSYFFYALALDALGKTLVGEDNYDANDDGVVWVFEKNLEPDEMQPFPFTTYAIDFLDLTDLGTSYIGHYYNEPTLDGVQYNVRILGESWEDTVNDVYFGTGLMCTSANLQTGPVRVAGMIYDTVSGGYVYDNNSAFEVNAAHIDKYRTATLYTYPTGGSATVSPVPQGTYSYPGVASVSVWYTWADYNEVPCYGKPISHEAWYSDNPSKTNSAVKFSGYTHFGDSGSVSPILFNTVPGHIRRYVCGVIKKDAVLATLTTTDIICGILYNGTSAGGEGYVVINGVVRGSVASTVAVESVQGSFDMFMYDLPTTFDQLSQTFDYTEIALYDGTSALIGFAGFAGNAGDVPELVTPIDVYDVKWAWYHHFIPDAGVGTYAGQVFASNQMMFTHPGWPV